MKDYYQILEIEISASQPEIKKAYRRLALQYHPDKNAADPYATAKFSEIKEAYEVLTNPARREYYLEQRWFHKAMGGKKTVQISNPVDLLKLVLATDRHISLLDIHRLNKEGIYQYIITELIPDENIIKLNQFKETGINKQVVSFLLKNLFVIPPLQLENLEKQLMKIETDDLTRLEIKSAILSTRKKIGREKYQIWILLLIVAFISVMIFLASR